MNLYGAERDRRRMRMLTLVQNRANSMVGRGEMDSNVCVCVCVNLCEMLIKNLRSRGGDERDYIYCDHPV